MKIRIKTEYVGKTIVKNTSLGNITVVIDNIDVSKYQYYVSIGFGYIFEEYVDAVNNDLTVSDAKSKTKRTKKRVSPEVHGGLGEQE